MRECGQGVQAVSMVGCAGRVVCTRVGLKALGHEAAKCHLLLVPLLTARRLLLPSAGGDGD